MISSSVSSSLESITLFKDDNINETSSTASTASASSSASSSTASLLEYNYPINDIKTVDDLESTLSSFINYVDDNNLSLSYKLSTISSILDNTNFTSSEVNRFTFWSNEKPYTRNCLINNDKFTVLLLCWNPNVKSAIHDHPCDACFIKVIRGCIKETKYIMEGDNITQFSNNFHIENQVSYMNNGNVLHSISNPSRDVGSVTLHVYTPPFSSCKINNPNTSLYILSSSSSSSSSLSSSY